MTPRNIILGLWPTIIVWIALSAAVAIADCPEPIPDPVGWWEWEGTFLNNGEWLRPGEGLYFPMQRHFSNDGVLEYYHNEALVHSCTYEVTCAYIYFFWSWCYFPPSDDSFAPFSISGEPGRRRMTVLQEAWEIYGSQSYWVERDPIDTVLSVDTPWSSLKSMYR